MVKGEALDIGRAAFITSLNLLSTTIFSLDLHPTGDSAGELKDTVWSIMEELGKPNLADYFPLLKKIDPQGVRKHCTVHLTKIMGLFNRIISQRLQSRKLPSFTTHNDFLNNLINISEENSEVMDKSRIERLFVVSLSLYN